MPNWSKLKEMANPMSHIGEDVIELAGLGILAAPSADVLQARLRARMAGDKNEKGRQLMPESWHDPVELAGLGVLAVPAGVKVKRYLQKHSTVAMWSGFQDELERMGL